VCERERERLEAAVRQMDWNLLESDGESAGLPHVCFKVWELDSVKFSSKLVPVGERCFYDPSVLLQ